MAHVKHTCGLRWTIPIPLSAQTDQRRLVGFQSKNEKERWASVKNPKADRDREELSEAFQWGLVTPFRSHLHLDRPQWVRGYTDAGFSDPSPLSKNLYPGL